jgi:hypothetical protein
MPVAAREGRASDAEPVCVVSLARQIMLTSESTRIGARRRTTSSETFGKPYRLNTVVTSTSPTVSKAARERQLRSNLTPQQGARHRYFGPSSSISGRSFESVR